MTTRDTETVLVVDGEHIAATFVSPGQRNPGVLFIHGWGGSQDQYLARARRIAELGCTCLTFDLRGHGATEDQQRTVTREQSLGDVLTAYDALARVPEVDPDAIAVVGSSYGGYLAAILTAMRPVRWLGLRVPALYKDDDWALPKAELRKYGLEAFRQGSVHPAENRALAACAAFAGDVLIVESERDEIIPHPVIANYMAAFAQARSLTYRVIKDADHGLTVDRYQQAYAALLIAWAGEMVRGSREAPADEQVAAA